MLLMAASGFAQSTCKVLGTVVDIADGEKVFLNTYAGNGRLLDSTIVKNGKFEFSIPATKELMENTVLIIHSRSQREWASTQILVEPDVTLKATLSYDHYNNKVYGSPLNFINSIYNERMKVFSDKILPLREASNDKKLSDAERKEIDKQADAALQEMRDFQQEFAYQNIDNALGFGIFTNYASMFDKDYVDKVLAEMPAKWNDDARVIKLREQKAVEAKTAEGQQFVDFTMPDTKGKDVTLGQYIKKNKLTLVDFWASWCGPCRKAIPGVKALYEKYKKQGFGVVGVSFDSKKENWLKAIKDEQLPWPQMSDLKGWGCLASDLYNIHGIPFTLLVTKDGTIVGRNIYDEEKLEERIQEYLK